jgi:hypothetical protein
MEKVPTRRCGEKRMQRFRQCPKCGKELPLSEKYFFRNKNRADGFACYCKKCLIEAQRKFFCNARLDRPRMTRGSKYFQRPRHFNGQKKHSEICLKCGREFDSYGNKICRKCSGNNYNYEKSFEGNNQMLIYFDVDGASNSFKEEHVKKAKALADKSGNPKIWTADEYSQDELRRLISTR